jgi:hypothetical protein
MMGFASSYLSKLLGGAKLRIKLVTLLLSASILPIGTEWVGKSLFELINQRAFWLQTSKTFFTRHAPIHTSMLLTSTRDAFDALKGSSLFLKPL